MDKFKPYFEVLKLKNIALIVQNADKEDDVHIYLGRLFLTGGECFFVNEKRGWEISLDSEQLNRLKPVPDTLKTMLLNADYFIPMVVQSLPDSDMQGYKNTGMKWHDDK